MKVPQQLMDVVSMQISALELKSFEISFINYHTGKKMADIYSQKTFFETEKTNGILHCGIERALYMNTSNNENVYIRAVPKYNNDLLNHHIVLLDDIKPDGLEYIAKHYTIACVIETSLDSDVSNMQIFMKLSEKFDCESRKCAERALIQELKSQGLYADPGAADGQHLARLAGFRNLGFEGKKERNHIVRIVEAPGGRLAPDTTAALIARGKALPMFKTSSFKAYSLDEITARPYDRQSIVNHMVELLPTVKPDANPSDVDFYLAMRLARCNYSENDICRVLIEKGPNDVTRKNDPVDYLSRTVTKALDKAHQTPPQGPTKNLGGRVVSSAPAAAPAAASGSQPTQQPIRLRPRLGVQPRVQQERDTDREKEKEKTHAQRDRDRDRERDRMRM